MIYQELTELNRRICHKFYESCKENHPNSTELTENEKQMLSDIDTLDRLVKTYFNAEFKDYAYQGI